ncbi:MAG: hypothetical protein FWC62_07520 [Firmicutes bacterium]|nr:hypothetical protein [Bacillota bacterium]
MELDVIQTALGGQRAVYNGVRVKTIPKPLRLFNKNRSYAFRGTVYLAPNILNGGPDEAVRTLRHEYGHTRQYARLGFCRYLFGIFLPSMTHTPREHYYSQKWEVTADAFGDVDRAGTGEAHLPGAEKDGEDYLRHLERRLDSRRQR